METRNVGGYEYLAGYENIKANLVANLTIKQLLKKFATSVPDDEITLTRNEDMKLIDLWVGDPSAEVPPVPADLLFAHRIPLMDFFLTIDERGAEDTFMHNAVGQVCKARIFIDPDYITAIGGGEWGMVGMIIVYCPSLTFTVPMLAKKGFDAIVLSSAFDVLTGEALPAKVAISAARLSLSWLASWYGIQIALLHPSVKEVFLKCREFSPYTIEPELLGRKGKRKTKYIRRCIVKSNELEEAIYGKGQLGNRKRHALIWHVIGHWRHYKSGKVIFVQPYWKGELRTIKSSLAPRDRIIETGGQI